MELITKAEPILGEFKGLGGFWDGLADGLREDGLRDVRPVPQAVLIKGKLR